MKNISLLSIGLSLLIFNQTVSALNRTDNPKELPVIQTGTNVLSVSCSPELYNLTQNWVREYNSFNSSSNVSLAKLNGTLLENPGKIAFVLEDQSVSSNTKTAWKMAVGRDVIVPIVNAKNPMLSLLEKSGISSEEFASLFNATENKSWSVLIPDGKKNPVRLYLSNDQNLIAGVEEFSKTKLGALAQKAVLPSLEVLAAVQSDPFAIGFCKLSDLRMNRNASLNEGIRLLPIDKNGNGRLDNFENIYTNLDEFTHGVWIGKYPNTLSNNILVVSQTKPTDTSDLAFISWILNEGQDMMNLNGFCDLTTGERQTNQASLIPSSIQDPFLANASFTPKSWPVFLTFVGLISLFLVVFFYSKRRAERVIPNQKIGIAPLLIENTIDVPKGLYFDKTHTWAFMEQDGNVRIGIDDFLQHITGKLTKIKMKQAGEVVRKGEAIMTIIQDGKQLNLYAPISGTILEQNHSLIKDAGMINSSPYFKGWVYQIEPKNWPREVQFMFMGDKYAEWLRDEFMRLKDFITDSVKSNSHAYAHVIIQDGGELTDNVLADLDPKIWEDFQTRFIDVSR
jgi:glycine cleavage system H lipoate-binding protein/ABC-type phosphate transport system substrate-binding protein